MRELMPHQEQALQFARGLDEVAFFMQMRLGKSLVAERWVREKCPDGRVLVVAPISTIPGWIEELRLEGHDPTWIRGDEETRRLLASNPRRKRFVMNPELFVVPSPRGESNRAIRIPRLLLESHWDAVIIDESTVLRNPMAKVTKVAQRAFQDVRYRAILSGLPNPESPMDFFEQMRWLHGEFMGHSNFYTWRHRYFMTDWTGYDWIPKRGTIEAIKEVLAASAFTLTRKQAGVGSAKVYERRFVEKTAEQRRLEREVREEFRVGERETNYVVVLENWLARIAGGFSPDDLRVVSDAKLRELMGLLRGELRGEQVVIWFRFNEELRHVQEALRSAGFRTASITGETDLDSRGTIRDLFKAGTISVVLAQGMCARYGMDLAASSTAIYYSNHWDQDTRAQTEDRIISSFKQEPVLYIDLITDDSIDEDVADALRDKSINAAVFRSRLRDAIRARSQGGTR